MSSTAFKAIANNEFRVLRQNTVVPIILVGMPLIVISMLRITMGVALQASGVPGANGSEIVVPGQALMFGFFVVNFVVNSFFREHGWFTWDRLRTSVASRFDILVAKTLPWAVLSCAQISLIVILGIVLFGLPIPSVSGAVAVFATAAAWALFVSGFALALAGLVTSMPAASAVSNLGAIMLAALGGALVPVAQLPSWAQAVAPFVPTYWAMRAFDAVFIDGGGISDAIGAIAVVAGFGVALGAFSWYRFDFDAAKRNWV